MRQSLKLQSKKYIDRSFRNTQRVVSIKGLSNGYIFRALFVFWVGLACFKLDCKELERLETNFFSEVLN